MLPQVFTVEGVTVNGCHTPEGRIVLAVVAFPHEGREWVEDLAEGGAGMLSAFDLIEIRRMAVGESPALVCSAALSSVIRLSSWTDAS